jgi:hypothetical protein
MATVAFVDPGQLSLSPSATLPLDPYELLGLPPLDRQAFYKELDLTFPERGCAEEAVQMARDGRYPEAAAASLGRTTPPTPRLAGGDARSSDPLREAR